MSNTQNFATALVTDNNDPEGLGRIKVQYPWDMDSNESYWARVVTFMSGNDFGAYFIPEIEDEVLVAFLEGDIEYPIIIGSLWNQENTPPHVTDDNTIRAIKSKSGHEVIFNDKEGSEKLEVKSSNGQSVVLDAANKKIKVEDPSGSFIEIDANSNAISIKSSMEIKISAGSNVSIEGTGNVDIKAGGILTLQGALVRIN